MRVVLADRLGDAVEIHAATAVGRQHVAEHAAEGRHAPDLPLEHVGVVAQDRLVAAPRVGQDRAQVSHRAAGDEQACLHTE